MIGGTSATKWAPLAAIAAAMIVVFAMGWHRAVTLENVVVLRDRFHHLLERNGAFAVAAYIMVYALVAALSLPGGLVLTLAGGLLFGWLTGGASAVVGASIGATAVFLIVRSTVGEVSLTEAAAGLGKMPGLGRQAERLRKLDTLVEQMKAGFRKDAMSYLLFLRLVPAFPFWVVNLVAAVLGVPLRTYVIATVVGIIPATFAFASLGAGLDSVVAAAKAQHVACVAAQGADACELKIRLGSLITRELVLAFVLLGLAALIPVVYKRWRNTDAAAE